MGLLRSGGSEPLLCAWDHAGSHFSRRSFVGQERGPGNVLRGAEHLRWGRQPPAAKAPAIPGKTLTVPAKLLVVSLSKFPPKTVINLMFKRCDT